MNFHPEAVEISRRVEYGEPICLYSDGTIRDGNGEYICKTQLLAGRRKITAHRIHGNGLIAWSFKQACELTGVRDGQA